MNLYCVKLLDKNNNVSDVQHIIAKSDKELKNILTGHMLSFKKYELDNEYNGYSFSKVDDKIIEQLFKLKEKQDNKNFKIKNNLKIK